MSVISLDLTAIRPTSVTSVGDRPHMPYVSCPHCGVRTYSAARWSHVDRCGSCGEVLTRTAKRPMFDDLEVEDRVRERLYGGPRSGSVDPVPRG